MKNFKKLRVWKTGINIATQTIKLTQTFPIHERFCLSQQMNRSAISIPSNIAEGSSRRSENDQRRFLEIALGSSFELETQLIIADAAGYGDGSQRNYLLSQLDEEQKMLMALMNRLQF